MEPLADGKEAGACGCRRQKVAVTYVAEQMGHTVATLSEHYWHVSSELDGKPQDWRAPWTRSARRASTPRVASGTA